MEKTTGSAYVQCVCGEADLRHLHVEGALVVAQSACGWTETGQRSDFLLPYFLPSIHPSCRSQCLIWKASVDLSLTLQTTGSVPTLSFHHVPSSLVC